MEVTVEGKIDGERQPIHLKFRDNNASMERVLERTKSWADRTGSLGSWLGRGCVGVAENSGPAILEQGHQETCIARDSRHRLITPDRLVELPWLRPSELPNRLQGNSTWQLITGSDSPVSPSASQSYGYSPPVSPGVGSLRGESSGNPPGIKGGFA